MIWPLNHLLESLRVIRADRLFPAVAPAPIASDGKDVMDLLARDALRLAVTQLGCGEDGRNNRGPDVARYCAPHGDGHNWCAAFVGWCYQEAARCMGIPLPFKRSLGAKRLGKNVGSVGRIFTDPALAKPGDLMVFARGAKGSWQGHVGLLERIDGEGAI